MSLKEKMVEEEVKMALEANALKEQGGTWSNDGLVQIVNDGNVTRQVMNAIGMDSLQTFEENQRKRDAEKLKVK